MPAQAATLSEHQRGAPQSRRNAIGDPAAQPFRGIFFAAAQSLLSLVMILMAVRTVRTAEAITSFQWIGLVFVPVVMGWSTVHQAGVAVRLARELIQRRKR